MTTMTTTTTMIMKMCVGQEDPIGDFCRWPHLALVSQNPEGHGVGDGERQEFEVESRLVKLQGENERQQQLWAHAVRGGRTEKAKKSIGTFRARSG